MPRRGFKRHAPTAFSPSCRPPKTCQPRPSKLLVETLEDRRLLAVTALGNEYQLNTTVASDQKSVAVGSNPHATQIVVAWTSTGEDGSGDGVYAQRYDLFGAKVGSAFRVNVTTSGNQSLPAVAMDSLGDFVITWQSSTGDGSGDGIYARRYGYDATALASEFRVNTSRTSGNQDAPAIAMNDNGAFAIAFQSATGSTDSSGNSVWAKLYNSSGTALATEFQTNVFTSGSQQAPAIAMDATGQVYVAWQSAAQDGNGDTVVARRYSATGTALATEFVVNQFVTGNQNAPSIAANSDGSFVVAWQSAGQDGNGDAIVARRYGTTGTALGNEFIVNQFTTGNQDAPSVSTTDSAGFVIAWHSALQDGNSDAVIARPYNADGTAAGNEFVANTFTTGAQNNASVGIEADGDFLVAWQSPGQETGGGTSLGVFARRFSVANDQPVMRQIANKIADVGSTISFTAAADDEDLPVDSVSYSLAAGAPAGATINASTGQFTWNTTGVNTGRYFATIMATDAAGATDQKSVAMTVFGPGERTALDDYVNAIDPSYSWDIRSRFIGSGFVRYDVHLVSGTWRTSAEVNLPVWQHWMEVYVPNVITSSKAALFIDGGSYSSTPSPNPDLDTYAGALAGNLGSVFIDLLAVPSEPLTFAGESSSRTEDEIIAYSWRQYLNTGDPTWIANLPMTRAAMRAMDAVSAFLGSPTGGNVDISSFVVSGGSKRGWTTWLAAAADPRVSDAVPIVSDLLNMETSFVHHYSYYNGTFSFAVQPYVDEGILNVNNFGTEGLDSLLGIVDPYTYLNRLTLPKYIVNVSGDEFFVPDSWKYYYDQLPGTKTIRYLPNSSHGISNSQYFLEIFTGIADLLGSNPLPQYSFHQLADGTIELNTSATVLDARLWQATNANARDFRYSVVGGIYTSSPLTDQGGGVFRANVPTPSKGTTAYYIELTVDSPLGALKVSTGIYLKGNPANNQPTLQPFSNLVVNEGSPLSIQAVAADPDAGQTLKYYLDTAPAQLAINQTTGLITGQWNDQVAGLLPVTVSVWDNGTPLLPDRQTFRITVVNVAPTATLGGPTAGDAGQPLSFTLGATDPSSADQAAGFTFTIDWNGDGSDVQTVVGASGTTVQHTFASAGNKSIRLTATDKDGGVSSASTLTVNLNRPPIDPQNQSPVSIFEGDSLALAASGWIDPDNDPLSYSWDINGDNVFGDAVGASPVLTWSQLNALGIVNGPSAFNVQVRVDDGRGGVTTSAPFVLSILNVPPTAGISGPSAALRGEQQTFNLTASDPVDQASAFVYTINWGDGSPLQTVGAATSAQVTHRFNAAGALTVSVVATDVDGDAGPAATKSVNVDAVRLRPNAGNPALADLVWGGTDGSDQVAFQQVDASTIRIVESALYGTAVSNSQTVTGVTGRVIAQAVGGADQLDARGLQTTSATLDGGAGNNTLYGGPAGDILIGGSDGGEGKQGNNVIIAGNGDNTIYGNGVTARKGASGGNNLIVGGTGNDTIYGNFGNNPTGNGGEGGQNVIVGGGGADTIYASQVTDGAEGGKGSILVAGRTTLDQTALLSVLSEWTSTHTLAARIANISGTGDASRLNGNNFLQPATTVFDDSLQDQIYSDTAGKENWLLVSAAQDNVVRRKATDISTDTP